MGVCVLKILKDKKIVPKYNVCFMGIRGEESCWFPYSYIGSKIALGLFEKQLLKKLKIGLFKILSEMKFNVDLIFDLVKATRFTYFYVLNKCYISPFSYRIGWP